MNTPKLFKSPGSSCLRLAAMAAFAVLVTLSRGAAGEAASLAGAVTELNTAVGAAQSATLTDAAGVQIASASAAPATKIATVNSAVGAQATPVSAADRTQSVAAGGTHSATEGATGEKVAVDLRVIGTRFWDGIDGATELTGSGDTLVKVGESGAVYVGVVGTNPSGRDSNSFCMDNVGGVAKEEAHRIKTKLLERNVHMWWADIRALPAEVGQVSLEISWVHFAPGPDGKPIRIAGDTRKVVMDEGEHHVLDFLGGQEPADPKGCYRNVTIDVLAELQEDPSLATETIAYDLWFKHTDRNGVVTAHRYQAAGRQGEKLDFRFAPMRFPVSGAVLNDGSILDSILDSSGEIRGRLRPDGTISVDVSVLRHIGAAAAGDPATGGYGAGGRKQVNIAAGETVSMVLPTPAGGGGYGYYDRTRSDGKSGPPLASPTTGSSRTVTVKPEFYAGHKDELIVTATRAN